MCMDVHSYCPSLFAVLSYKYTLLHTQPHTHNPTSQWLMSWRRLISWEWMWQNYKSSGVAIALLHRHWSMSDCLNAGMREDYSVLSICLFVYFSQTSLSLSDSFFFVSLLSCLLHSLCPAILCPFHYPFPGVAWVAYLVTSCLNHSKDVQDIPLYFSLYNIIPCSSFFCRCSPSLLLLSFTQLSLLASLFSFSTIPACVIFLYIFFQTLKA